MYLENGISVFGMCRFGLVLNCIFIKQRLGDDLVYVPEFANEEERAYISPCMK